MGKLHSETPGDAAPAPTLTFPDVEKAGNPPNSDGGLGGPATSGGSTTVLRGRSLTAVDMLSIQYAIDLYEKKFPHQPSPTAEVALAWLANRRGHRGWGNKIASPVKRLMTLLRHDGSVAATPKSRPVAKITPRHASWRQPFSPAGGAIVATALITLFYINNRQGPYVRSVTSHARQRATLATGGAVQEEPSATIASEPPSAGSAARSAAHHTPAQDESTTSIESSSTTADQEQAGAPDVAVPQSENEAEIRAMLNGWAKAMNSNDVTLQMQYYGDRLNRYFLARNVTQAFVVQDKARFYRNGNHIIAFHIDNVAVDKQADQQATVSLVKHWEISHQSGTRSGETRSRLWLTRRGNRWTITGEQDLTSPQPASEEQVLRTSAESGDPR